MPPKKAISKTIPPISTILPGDEEDDRKVTAVKRIYDVGQDPSIFKTFGVPVPTFEENKHKWGGVEEHQENQENQRNQESQESQEGIRNNYFNQ